MRTPLAALAALAVAMPAHAIVGGGPADPSLQASVVSIVSTVGASCSGTVVGRNLVLTAGHCVDRKGNYAVLVRGREGMSLAEIDGIAIHPDWTRELYTQRRPSPDIALVRTKAPLPGQFRPLALSGATGLPANGTKYTLAGWGFAEEGNEKSAGALRAVVLDVALRYVAWQARLKPTSEAPAGACHYDSGGAVLTGEGGRPALAGVIALALGEGKRQCGAATVVSMIGPARAFIEEAARTLGARLGE